MAPERQNRWVMTVDEVRAAKAAASAVADVDGEAFLPSGYPRYDFAGQG